MSDIIEGLKKEKQRVKLRFAEQGGGSDVIYREKKTFRLVDKEGSDTVAYRRFWAHPSTPEEDTYGTEVAPQAIRNAWPKYIETGNIRFMHERKTVARIFQEDYEERVGLPYVGVSVPLHKQEILDDIDSGLLNGLSLGFNARSIDEDLYRREGTVRFTEIEIVEISVVDSYSTPGTLWQEERFVAEDKHDYKLFQRFMAWIKQDKNQELASRSAEEEEEEMKSEDFDKIGGMISSALEGFEERLQAKKEDPPETKEEKEETPELDAKGIVDGVFDRMKPVLDKTNERLDALERGAKPAGMPDGTQAGGEGGGESESEAEPMPFAGGLIEGVETLSDFSRVTGKRFGG